MKHSIKRTFTLIFVAIVAALLLTMYIVNRFFLPNDDTLLYGVEVKFYNMEVKLNERWRPAIPGCSS